MSFDEHFAHCNFWHDISRTFAYVHTVVPDNKQYQCGTTYIPSAQRCPQLATPLERKRLFGILIRRKFYTSRGDEFFIYHLETKQTSQVTVLLLLSQFF